MASPEVLIQKNLLRMMRQGTSSVDLDGFLVEMLDVFGGPRALAQEFKKVYDLSKDSPMVRQKILQLILSLIHASTVHGFHRSLDFSSFSDADLEELSHLYLDRMIYASQQAPTALAGADSDGPAPDAAPADHPADEPAD